MERRELGRTGVSVSTFCLGAMMVGAWRNPDHDGRTPIQLAIAFVLDHPAITAPLIGPRTLEQLETQLAAVGVGLDEQILDRIDAINPPGTTVDPAGNSWTNPDLEPAARRR